MDNNLSDTDEEMLDVNDCDEIIELNRLDQDSDDSLEETLNDFNITDKETNHLTNDYDNIDAIYFQKHSKPVFSVDMDLKNHVAISGGQDDIAYAWIFPQIEAYSKSPSETPILIKPLIINPIVGFTDSVIFTKFNANRQLVAIIDISGKIQIFKVQQFLDAISSDKKINPLIYYDLESDVSCAYWHPIYNTSLIVGTESGELNVLNFDTSSKSTNSPSSDLVKSKILASGTSNKINVCRVVDDHALSPATGDAKNSRLTNQIILGYLNGDIEVWDLRASTCLLTIANRHNEFHNPGPETDNKINRLPYHTSEVTCLDLYWVDAPNTTRYLILSGSTVGHIKLHNGPIGEHPGRYLGEFTDANDLNYKNIDQLPNELAVVGGDENAAFAQEDLSIESLEFSSHPSNKDHFMTANLKGILTVWDFKQRRINHQWNTESGITKAQWLFPPTPDGSNNLGNSASLFPVSPSHSIYIVSAHLDGSFAVWDGRTGAPHWRIRPHTDVILDFVISPDATYLATCSEDCTAKIIHLKLNSSSPILNANYPP